MALHFDLLNFEIGDRGVQHGVPIDETLVLIDQPLAIKLDEHLQHRARKPFVEREPLARPVAGGAEPLQLLDDDPAQLGLPLPDALQKFLAAHLAAARLLAFRQLALDHHLRRYAGVIGAGLPQHILALHPRVTRENVLQRVVERVPHMQRARDIGRRNDDGIGRGAGALGTPRAKGAGGLPLFADAALDGGGIEGFFHGHIFGSGVAAPLIRPRYAGPPSPVNGRRERSCYLSC